MTGWRRGLLRWPSAVALQGVDELRRLAAAELGRRTAEAGAAPLLHATLVQAPPAAGDGVDSLHLGSRRPRLVAAGAAVRSSDGGVDDPRRLPLGVLGREVEVLAELGAESQGGKGPAQGLRLRLFDVVLEVAGGLTAPARGLTAFREANPSAKQRQTGLVLHQLRGDDRLWMLAAQPEQAPLDLQVLLAV